MRSPTLLSGWSSLLKTHLCSADTSAMITPEAALDGAAETDESAELATTPTGNVFRRYVTYIRARRLSLLDLLVLTAMYVTGVTAGALMTELLLADDQIAARADTPIWGKLATSYAGFVIYFMHLRAIIDARDLRRDPAAAHPRVRGLLTPGELIGVALILLAAETVLLANVGELRLSVWFVAVAFSFALYADLGIGRWLRRSALARSAAHAVAYLLVMAMLVAAAWEATVTFGLFGGQNGILITTGKQYDGLQIDDLFIAQPLASGLLYAAAFALAWAMELHQHPPGGVRRQRLTRLLGAVGGAALVALLVVLLPDSSRALHATSSVTALSMLAWATWPTQRALGWRSLLVLVAWSAPAVALTMQLDWV